MSNIHGNKVILRAIEEPDLPLFHQWGNDADMWRFLGGWHFPVSVESTQEWYDKVRKDSLNLRLAIQTKDGHVVGMINLLEIDWKNRHASHGIMLGEPSARGQGIGLDAVMALMRYAFDELGFARIDSSIIEGHGASIGLYCGKCGWKEEGRQRKWYFREGRFWDRIMIGITKEDYEALVAQTRYWG